jgi:hypothetical protein
LAERKNFLIIAIGMGAFGVIVGGITIWNLVSQVINP